MTTTTHMITTTTTRTAITADLQNTLPVTSTT